MGNKRNYTIYTFDGRKIMKLCALNDRRFDMESEFDRKNILIDESKFANNALMKQIVLAAQHLGDTRRETTIISRSLIYLNFGNAGVADMQKETEQLLKEGFEIKFRGDHDFTKFCVFDKSSSMSRENTISFIAEELFKEVDRALDCGIDRSSQKFFPSKYYAYRGLYMTDGSDVSSGNDDLILNERTVIVLKNKAFKLHEQNGITVRGSRNAKGNIYVNEDTKEKVTKFKVTPYDGEGIISPEYALAINKMLENRGGKQATSFQIRMPFVKGMLHKADFRRFLSEEIQCGDIDALEVTDYYGFKRRLADAEIILTDSMFKCAKWLEKQLSIHQEDMEEGNPEIIGYTCDPMKYYFEHFKEFNHALYVSNTDTNIRGDKLVKMNYQFFNTLDLDRQTFEAIVNSHIKQTKVMLNDPVYSKAALLSADYDDEEDIDRETYNNIETWEYALATNTKFIEDPYVRKRLKQIVKGRIGDIIGGRILVEGTTKYLSGDLLDFLISIAINSKAGSNRRIRNIKRAVLAPDRMYIAGKDDYGLSTDEYYGMLRSPHLSRNEQCMLRPHCSDLYEKYFGDLAGIVMLSNRSCVPAALAGADFDGDLVKVIFDKDINAAIASASYEIDDNREPDTIGIMPLKRIHPVPIIPSQHGFDAYLGDHITFYDLSASFNNMIGQISNLAITLAKKEYGADLDSAVPANSAALCTIATGLEIDAVKSGAKPDFAGLRKLRGDDAKKKEKDIFLDAYSKMKDVKADKKLRNKAVYAKYDEKKCEYVVYHKFKFGKNKEKKLYSIKADQKYNIDILPYMYAEVVAEKDAFRMPRKGSMSGLPNHCFIFELYDNWREAAEKDPRSIKLKGIMRAYRKFNADSWNIANAKEKAETGSLRGHVDTLLDVEYDKEIDRLYRSDMYIEGALESAYQEINRLVKSKAEADEILKLMDNTHWPYSTNFDLKVGHLADLLGTSDLPLPALEIICDTYDNGYQILNYIVRDIRDLREYEELHQDALTNNDEDSVSMETDSEEELEVRSGESVVIDYDEEIYRRIFAKYKLYYMRDDYNKTDWIDDAGNICREAVLELFNGDVETAIQYAVAFDKEEDANHNFLWRVFTKEDIHKVIYGKDGNIRGIKDVK